MIRWMLIALAVVLPGLVSAQAITLRSGEHADFARLVAFLPGEPEWTVDQYGRTVEVQIAGTAQYEFDTSAIFDRIPKTRIAAVSQPARNQLRIEMACDCAVSSFFQAPRMLVIDVADPSEDTDQARATPPSTSEDAMPTAPAAMQEALIDSLNQRTSYSTSGLTQIAEALAESTTRAVLDLGEPDAARPDRTVTIGTDFQNVNIPNIALPNVAGAGGAGARKKLPAACDALARAPLGDITDDVDFAAEKARITAQLYTERLDLDGKVAIELAQLYLSQGLGAEARQAVDMAEDKRKGAVFLADIAVLIENPGAVARESLEPYEECSPDNAIWPVLAAPRRPMSEDDAWQVARAAETLPRPLLRSIAPQLITNLIGSGQPDPANMVAKILERSGGSADKSMADVLLVEEEAAKDEILEDIARSNGEEAAQATAMLIERRVEQGEPVPERLSDLVASHAEEQRHGDAGGMLRKAEAFSLISRGEFEQALAILKAGTLDDRAQEATVAQFFRELARSAQTVTFLKIALSEPTLAAAAPADIRQTVAARLYENRFHDAAAMLFDPSEPLERELVTKALSARTFGDVGIPDDLLFAEADPNPEADEARYRALLSSGRFTEARQVALGLGKTDPVDALLALEEDGTTPEDAEGDAAELSLARATGLTETTSTLARTVAEMLDDPALALAE